MATEIAIKSIVLLPEIYPRFRIHQERIKYFVEHIKSGKEIPPLKVSNFGGRRDDGKKYVLLDGCHRLEALKSLGEKEVKADFFDAPRGHWLLLSARFNAESAIPLTRGELKHVIIVSYLNGIKDTHEIARLMGGVCTLRYIQLVLKHLRQPDRRKRDRQIRLFHRQGLTQQEIARKAGVTQSRVAQIINKRNCSFTNTVYDSNKLAASKRRKVDIIPTRDEPLDTRDIQKNQNAALPSAGTTNAANAFQTEPLETSDEGPLASSRKPKAIPFQTRGMDIESFLEGEGEDLRQTALELKADIDEYIGHLSPSNKYRGPEKDSCVPDIEAIFKTKLTTKEFNALRAMELVKQLKWDLVHIAEHTGESVQFLRRVLIVALALAICPNERQEEVFWTSGSRLRFDTQLMMTISDGLVFEAMMAPLGEGMPEWVEDNLTESDIALIAGLVSRGSSKIIPQDIPDLLLQKKPLKQRTRYHVDLPDDVKTRLEGMKISLREFRDLLNKGMLRVESLSQFMKLYNRIKTVMNEIDEALKICKKRGYF